MAAELNGLYDDLQDNLSLRLMILQPGGPVDPINAELFTVRLDSAPVYDAISMGPSASATSRAWVLQEVGMAKVPLALYGNIEFRYRDLVKLMQWLHYRAPTVVATYHIQSWFIHSQWADWSSEWQSHTTHNGLGLLDLLDHATVLNCGDPRDHIYAFLGHPLAQKGNGSPVVTPDYTKSVDEVFLDISTILLRENGLRMLSTVEHDESTIGQDSPSWVIQWDISGVWNNISQVPWKNGASLPPALQDSVEINHKILKLPGTAVDTVFKSFQIDFDNDSLEVAFVDSNTNEALDLDHMLRYVQRRGTLCVYNYDQNERALAFVHTLCAGVSHSAGGGEVDIGYHWEHFLDFWKWHRDRHTLSGQEGRPPGLSKKALSFWNDMCDFGIARSFAITDRGYYGLVPRISKPGDVCCWLHGANVPFVLRAQDADHNFRLIGEAYVFGLMQGQAYDHLSRGELEEMTFVIK
ncbi:hypothetical protein DL765_005790 [Monosporascus sp. GIB2]|nr:hypothetical protein DL765_005790 [Monosporascus sp. GIB2]